MTFRDIMEIIAALILGLVLLTASPLFLLLACLIPFTALAAFIWAVTWIAKTI